MRCVNGVILLQSIDGERKLKIRKRKRKEICLQFRFKCCQCCRRRDFRCLPCPWCSCRKCTITNCTEACRGNGDGQWRCWAKTTSAG